MPQNTALPINSQAVRLGIAGAALTIVGILTSGPIGTVLVSAIHPSPPWQDAELFALNFHWIQTVPFFAGFALVGGYVVLFAALQAMAAPRHRAAATSAVIFAAVFATFIFFNYICQTTFIPALAQSYRPEYEPLISALSFANPLSLSWAIEMWGYAFLGVASWIAARIFDRGGVETAVARLMDVNAVISIAGAFVTVARPGWVLTSAGLINYVAWNIVVLAISILIVVALRKRLRDAEVSGRGNSEEERRSLADLALRPNPTAMR